MEPISISNSELELMKLLWECSPLSAPALVERVRRSCDWEENTIRTLLARLVKKGAVEQQGQKRSYTYVPRITRDEYREEASCRLVEQVFNSRPGALMSFFVRKGKLSREDIAELKQLLKEAEDNE